MCLNAHPGRRDAESETLIPVNRCDIDVVYSIQERAVSENIDAGPQGSGIGEDVAFTLEARNKVQAVAYRSTGNAGTYQTGDAIGALANTNDQNAQFIAYDMRGRDGGAQMEGPHDAASVRAGHGGASRSFVAGMGVRRLTPVECMRLQSFPDDYFDGVLLRGKQMADGPIYKCLGNSMNVKMMAWVMARIDASAARIAALRTNEDGV